MDSRLLLLFLLAILNSFCSLGQHSVSAPVKELITYRTGFFNNYWKDPDSALYFARKIAANTAGKPYLRQMIHDDFYMMFHDDIRDSIRVRALRNNTLNWERQYQAFFDTIYHTLSLLSMDPDPRLAGTATPLLYWVKVIKNRQHIEKIAPPLIEAFIQTQFDESDDFYDNATPRYALFIYQELIKYPELNDLASTLIRVTLEKLSGVTDSVLPELVNRLPKNSMEKRAWLRSMLSYANNFMARRLLNEGRVKKAGDYFATAFNYAPDLNDRGCTNIYTGDSNLFWDGVKNQVEIDYLNYLKNHGGEDRLLYAYIVLAFRDPVGYRKKLKEAYDRYYDGDRSFSELWLESVNSRLRPAPTVKLQQIDGGAFSSSENQGKWILIDFWGTWCGPCREEHPQLQKFYDDFISAPENNIVLYTIACRDKEERVRSYQSEFNYSFPVAMADNRVIEAFNVQGYPTKVLITPQGNYLKIPFGSDWVNFIKEYISLN